MCEHTFPLGDGGTPYGRFSRAIATGNALLALSAAAELTQLSLADALRLVLVLEPDDPDRYARAAARWLGRYIVEVGGVDLGEAQLIAASFAALGGGHQATAVRTLEGVFSLRGLGELVGVLQRAK